jgi:hypothetical protein
VYLADELIWRSVTVNVSQGYGKNNRAEESTRETEEKLDGRNKEGHERDEPARRPVGR